MTRTIRAEVDEYVKRVLHHQIVAGKLVHAACRRYLDDHRAARSKGWRFDDALADRAVRFASLLRHTSGEYAGQPFMLVDFQRFIVANLFGWRRAETGLRRFQRAFISMASGNGKTPFAACLMLMCTFFDYPIEPRAHGYVVSTTRSQARPVLDEVKAFIAQDHHLRSLVSCLKDNVHCQLTHSKIEILGSEGTVEDGLVPHCVVYDELHRAKERHRATLDMIRSKMGKRRQPLLITITTAGDDRSELWREQYEMARRVVERGNEIEADDLFVYIAELDDDEEIWDERAWPKANPMLPHGVVKIDQLRSDVALARLDEREKKRVMRLRMNRLVTSSIRPITTELWATGNLPLPELTGRECFAGLDLGWKDDLAACVYAFALGDITVTSGLKPRIALLCDVWIPGETPRNLAEEPWASWIRDGWLRVTPGEVTDIDAIYARIAERNRQFSIRSLALDPNNARAPGIHIETTLGIRAFWFAQTTQRYNEPTRELLDALHEGRIIHGGNPVLAWSALNLALREDHRGYMMPAKRMASEKIDPIVAAIMAISELMYARRADESVYSQPGNLAL